MKLIHKLFHRMTNRSCKLQGCSLSYTGMAKDVDVPVLSLTLGMSASYRAHLLTKVHNLFGFEVLL